MRSVAMAVKGFTTNRSAVSAGITEIAQRARCGLRTWISPSSPIPTARPAAFSTSSCTSPMPRPPERPHLRAAGLRSVPYAAPRKLANGALRLRGTE